MMKRNIRLIHQIELSSMCNLTCKYCVHPIMKRDKIHMGMDVFLRSIDLVSHAVKQYGQNELNLCGIGESTLHPNFCEMVGIARKVLGKDVTILLSTNGIAMPDDVLDAIQNNNIKVFVSLHRPERAGKVIEKLKQINAIIGVDGNAAISATDWAGQVNWFVSSPVSTCFWIPDGRVFIDSNGHIRSCCYDGNGLSHVGHIYDDDIFSKQTMPYDLCKTCHMNNNLGLVT